MKIFTTLVVLFLFSLVCFSQEASREQEFQQIQDLSGQTDKIFANLLLPSPTDAKLAESENVKVFRLMSREVHGRAIAEPQGGGAYYSFTTGSHHYQKIAQISLEQRHLSTGFAGANYGLMGDLGDIPLSDVTSETPAVSFLLKYKAPGNILEARAEQRRSHDYQTDVLTFRRRVPVRVGQTLVLRALDFGDADILVVFKVIRQDTDGSLIIFWKQVANFGKPQLDPNIREN